jgi:hypothetical protein
MLRLLLLSAYLFLLATFTLTAGDEGDCPCRNRDSLNNKVGGEEMLIDARDCLPNERTHYTIRSASGNVSETNDTVVLRFGDTDITNANKFIDSVCNSILTSTVAVVSILTDIKGEREYRKNKILILIFSILLVVALLGITYGYYTSNRLIVLVGSVLSCAACIIMAISIATCISLS